jgi:NitT/TauT family transport system substrate-binding protein
LLRAEGFTDIRYLEMPAGSVPEAIGHGKLDFALNYATIVAVAIDRGEPLTVLGGVHVGCFELFGNGAIRGIADLKGKTVGVAALGASDHLFLSVMAAHVGLNPSNDIHWITSESPTPAELFEDHRIDACLSLPPVAQDLRARHVGRVVINSALDRPWSQYLCCMLYSNSGFVRKYPTATKRVMRAILRAADICATDPARVAKQRRRFHRPI